MAEKYKQYILDFRLHDGTTHSVPFDVPVGDPGVHFGSDRPPDTATVWVDPNGEPTSTEDWDFTLYSGTTETKRVVVVGAEEENGHSGILRLKDENGVWREIPALVGPRGFRGEKGVPGVYVGSDTPPDDAMVWVNPEGEPTSTEDWEFAMEDGSRDTKRVVVVGAEESNGYAGILMVRQEDGSWKEIPAIAGSNADYTLPVATAEMLGGVKPVAKTEAMTQPVGVDEKGALYTEPVNHNGSGGNVDQATPESFGAVGDGVTDDTEAITLALAASKNVVFDGDKTYAVGSTIVIPADAMVDFRGATIVPTGNHDVIRVMPGSLTENLVVRCTGVSGWDSAAVVLYGGDHFRAYNPTVIKNVKLYNNTSSTAGLTTQGVGIKLYGDKFGDFVEGITVEEVSTYGFGIGMLFEGVPDDMENPTGGLVFIGANKFRGYWSFYDNQGIVMPCRHPNTHVTNNIFTDLQIEPKNVPQKDKQSSYGIYCRGFSNYFEGCLYDFFNGHTAVFFDNASNNNVVKSTSGLLHSHINAEWYKDRGINNTVIVLDDETKHAVPYTGTTPCMNGNQDDYFAFFDKRANCTLESLDGEPVYGSLANVFNPNPSKTLRYKAMNPYENNRRARITINCDVAIDRITNFYLQFYSPPKSVKITFYNATDVYVVFDTDDNVNKLIGVTTSDNFGLDFEYHVSKIVIELGGFSNVTQSGAETYGEWELVRIMAVNSYRAGNTWVSRDGGEMYGNIRFAKEKGIVLTAANGKKFLLSVSDTGTLTTSEYIEEEKDAPEVAVLTPVLKAGTAWYDVESSGIEQSAITSVVFDANYVSTGEEDASWACDEDENGNIMAYRNGTEVTIKSTTGSEGVKLNPDSSYMFANDGTKANFAALASVSGTETLVADKNTSIAYICRQNTRLTEPICIPEGVTTIKGAFNGCTSLATPPKLPNGAIDLSNIFAACTSLQTLPDIPATVTNMSYAFHGCTAATKAPSVIPESVTNLTYAFRTCVLLSGTIEVNAVNLGDRYDRCFELAARDTDGVVLTGSCTLLAELAATNADGKVTVASA